MMIRGIPISPGVAVARAYRLDPVVAKIDAKEIDAAALSSEVSRFDTACAAASAELDDIIKRVVSEIGEAEAEIFRSHRALLRDPSLVGKVRNRILTENEDAATALQVVLEEYTALFAKIPDEYLRERLADIRDVVHRLQTQLTIQTRPECLADFEAVVLCAPEIMPSHAVMFDRMQLVGIATEKGGATGHGAILARSLAIAAVSGLNGLLEKVKTGDLVVIDGRDGLVVVNPEPEAESAYRKLEREYFDLRGKLVENADQQAVTKDGTSIELQANINHAADAANAARVGAVGIGLYRTEYLFLTHHSVPDEEEQLAAYRAVIEAAPGKSVTIRTLDLGGDKQVPYFGHGREANPFMGCRSIRLSTAYPDFFLTQLRAVLRAGMFGDVKIMFPMVSNVEEVRHVKGMVAEAQRQLASKGIPFQSRLPLGVMIEVPAAAICVDNLLDEADFVSIGSNDLIQYVMAADRDNPRVTHLCEPFGPALFRLLHQVITACNRRRKPVTLCGEMAGRPRCVLPLLGMGLRSFSMSPAFVPNIKQLIRSVDLRTTREVLDLVLAMRTVQEVKSYLTQTVTRLCPDVALFDTFE